jgi:hypothetical protein
MESWDNENYYTTDPVKWVQLMNQSTAEWGVGYFPPNVVALNDSYSFDNNTFVIQNAAQADVDSRPTENIIFGVTSAFAIAWGIIYVLYNLRKKTLFRPLGSNGASDNASLGPGSYGGRSGSVTLSAMENGDQVTAREFEKQMFTFYYPPGLTELEVYEKDLRQDGLGPEDVEDVNALVRKMLGFDQALWSQRNSTYFRESQRDELRENSDAVLAEIRRNASAWYGQRGSMGWTPDEQRELQTIAELLDGQRGGLPERRYS